MIEFMVIGNPRSGTTWAANWLTTDTSICFHDPLTRWAPDRLDHIESVKVKGVACTGLALWPDWLNAHPARKVILHRPAREIRESMEAHGFHGFVPAALEKISGLHVDWRDLFIKPDAIYEHLLQSPLDIERHKELRQMNVQVDYECVVFDREAARKYANAFNRALN